jgi:hypothetical protein
VTAFGETKCTAAWADDPRCAVSYDTLKQRLAADWEPERALTKLAKTEDPNCPEGHPYSYQAGQRKCLTCYNKKRQERRALARLTKGGKFTPMNAEPEPADEQPEPEIRGGDRPADYLPKHARDPHATGLYLTDAELGPDEEGEDE